MRSWKGKKKSTKEDEEEEEKVSLDRTHLLSQLSVSSTISAKITSSIARKSNITDMARLEDLRDRVAGMENQTFEQLKKQVEKLTDTRVRNRGEFDAVIAGVAGGLAGLSSPPPNKHKKGSPKDQYVKQIAKYLSELGAARNEMITLTKSMANESLDETQARAIQIIRSGRSLLLMGKPGSGKTHCALYALNNFVIRQQGTLVIYVAPTSELVLQAKANLSKTFPRLSISMLSELLAEQCVAGHQIIVGTPVELWTFISSKNIRWDIGIFDEIHTLSCPDGNATTTYTRCLRNLLTGVGSNAQVICLSATIHREDVARLMTYITTISGVADMEVLTLDYTPVIPRNLCVEGTGSGLGLVPFQVNETHRSLTPRDLFGMFLKLGMHGTIVFCEDDTTTWDTFIELLEWLDHQNAVYYGPILNQQACVQSVLDTIRKDQTDLDAKSHLDGSERPSVQAEIGSLEKKIADGRKKIRGLWFDVVRKHFSPGEENTAGFIETISQEDLFTIENLASEFSGFRQPVAVGSQCSLACKYALNLARTMTNAKDVGPFFRLIPDGKGIDTSEFDAFMKMNIHRDAKGKETVSIQSDSQAQWSAVNNLIQFAQSESISIGDIKEVIRVFIKSTRYGISLMMPSLPFVVTHTVRKLMNDRSMPFVFATQDMAVGINYSLRNVVIMRRKEESPPIPGSLVVQMKGRAGRRGLDTESNIVGINVNNLVDEVADRMHFPPAPEEGVFQRKLSGTLSAFTDPKRLLERLNLTITTKTSWLVRAITSHLVPEFRGPMNELLEQLIESEKPLAIDTETASRLVQYAPRLSSAVYQFYNAITLTAFKENKTALTNLLYLDKSIKQFRNKVVRCCFRS